MTQEQEQSLREWVSGIGAIVWSLSALAAACLIGYQCLHWLKSGTWLSYQAIETFRYFGMDPISLKWIGLRKIVVWLAQLPLSLWLIVAPGVLFATAHWIVEEQINEARKRRANEG